MGLPYTGERIVPGHDNPLFQLHLAVYQFIAPRIHGLVILDAGCGEGYGPAILATSKALVVGIDRSFETIIHAAKKYTSPRLSFLVADCEEIPFPDRFFDAVCSVEVIEHLKDHRRYLSEVRRILKEGGQFAVSTPNKRFSFPCSAAPINPFHVVEFSLENFLDVLLSYFSNVQIHGLFDPFRLRDPDTEITRHQVSMRYLQWDFIGLRRLIPRAVKRFIYRRLIGIPAEDVTSVHYPISSERIEEAVHFIAICQTP